MQQETASLSFVDGGVLDSLLSLASCAMYAYLLVVGLLQRT